MPSVTQASFATLKPYSAGSLVDGRTARERAAAYVGGTRVSEKPFEQSHLLIGFPSPSYREGEFFTAQVFSGLFGGGMSSRLFQEVREKRGLCYAIYSTAWGLKDVGLFGLHAATGARLDGQAHRRRGGGAEARSRCGARAQPELARSKAQLKAGLLMSLESSSARAEQMARHLLSHGRVVPAEELIAKVDDVTREHVRDVRAQSSPRAGRRSPSSAAAANRSSTRVRPRVWRITSS